MAYQVRCDSCDLDRWLDDRIAAHQLAKEHEASYRDHFVSLRDDA